LEDLPENSEEPEGQAEGIKVFPHHDDNLLENRTFLPSARLLSFGQDWPGGLGPPNPF
jgi:hypothetical protein